MQSLMERQEVTLEKGSVSREKRKRTANDDESAPTNKRQKKVEHEEKTAGHPHLQGKARSKSPSLTLSQLLREPESKEKWARIKAFNLAAQAALVLEQYDPAESSVTSEGHTSEEDICSPVHSSSIGSQAEVQTNHNVSEEVKERSARTQPPSVPKEQINGCTRVDMKARIGVSAIHSKLTVSGVNLGNKAKPRIIDPTSPTFVNAPTEDSHQYTSAGKPPGVRPQPPAPVLDLTPDVLERLQENIVRTLTTCTATAFEPYCNTDPYDQCKEGDITMLHQDEAGFDAKQAGWRLAPKRFALMALLSSVITHRILAKDKSFALTLPKVDKDVRVLLIANEINPDNLLAESISYSIRSGEWSKGQGKALAKKFARQTVDDYSSNGTFRKLFGCRRAALEPLCDIFVPLFLGVLQLKAFLQLSQVKYRIDWPVREGKQRFPCQSMLPLELAMRTLESHVTFAPFPANINTRTGEYLLKALVVTEPSEVFDSSTTSALEDEDEEGVCLPSVEYLDSNLEQYGGEYKKTLAHDVDDSHSSASHYLGWCYGVASCCDNGVCEASRHAQCGPPDWADVKGVASMSLTVDSHLAPAIPKGRPVSYPSEFLSINEVCAAQGKHLIEEECFEPPKLGPMSSASESEQSSDLDSSVDLDPSDSDSQSSDFESDVSSGGPADPPFKNLSAANTSAHQTDQASHTSKLLPQAQGPRANVSGDQNPRFRPQKSSKKRSHDETNGPPAAPTSLKRARLMPHTKQSTGEDASAEHDEQGSASTSRSPERTRPFFDESVDMLSMAREQYSRHHAGPSRYTRATHKTAQERC